MSGPLRIHFQDLGKQAHAARLGMWLLLVSEVLLFSGLFVLYATYRIAHPHVFSDAVHHAYVGLGTAMTLVLITSSLLVALGVHRARDRSARAAFPWLSASALLGVLFLGIKLYEYLLHAREGALPGAHYHFEKIADPAGSLFYTLYFFATGLHALHVAAGVALLGGVAFAVRRGRVRSEYPIAVELAGMYWHLVDVIWLFLWPLFYLVE